MRYELDEEVYDRNTLRIILNARFTRMAIATHAADKHDPSEVQSSESEEY